PRPAPALRRRPAPAGFSGGGGEGKVEGQNRAVDGRSEGVAGEARRGRERRREGAPAVRGSGYNERLSNHLWAGSWVAESGGWISEGRSVRGCLRGGLVPPACRSPTWREGKVARRRSAALGSAPSATLRGGAEQRRRG